jgi:hypothetical protein
MLLVHFVFLEHNDVDHLLLLCFFFLPCRFDEMVCLIQPGTVFVATGTASENIGLGH